MTPRVLLTGSTGFLGHAVEKQLKGPFAVISTAGRTGAYDLRDPKQTWDLFAAIRPTQVVHLAYPGSEGIGTAAKLPLHLATDCLRIDTNVIEACVQFHVEHLICVGSVCQYPQYSARRWAEQSEADLFDGAPEPTNAPYGHAKRMQLALLQAARTQANLPSVQLILDNLYGPGDRTGHVIPATIRKVQHAIREGHGAITAWGDGAATREFVYVDDAATAIFAALIEGHHQPAPINIVSSDPISMRALVSLIAGLCDYEGVVQWDNTKPEGQKVRHFSGARAQAVLGWAATTKLPAGLRQTVQWWRMQEP